MVDEQDNSNQLVVNEVVVDGSVEDVWEAVASDAGRAEWIAEPGAPEPTVVVESQDAPHRISWWWWSGEGDAPRRVELWIAPVPAGTRVIAVESAPALPLTMLASACTARV